jgi:hypothetical protein
VIDGSTEQAVATAMAAGIRAASGDDLGGQLWGRPREISFPSSPGSRVGLIAAPCPVSHRDRLAFSLAAGFATSRRRRGAPRRRHETTRVLACLNPCPKLHPKPLPRPRPKPFHRRRQVLFHRVRTWWCLPGSRTSRP